MTTVSKHLILDAGTAPANWRDEPIDWQTCVVESMCRGVLPFMVATRFAFKTFDEVVAASNGVVFISNELKTVWGLLELYLFEKVIRNKNLVLDFNVVISKPKVISKINNQIAECHVKWGNDFFSNPRVILKALANLVSKYDRKRRGDVRTPLNLVDEIVDKVDEKKPDYEDGVIDPACGNGSFLIVVQERVSNAPLVGVDINPRRCYIASALLNPYNDKKNVEIYCENFLEASVKRWSNRKFGLALGNPPFNEDIVDIKGHKRLYDKFLESAVDITTGVVSLIIPSKCSNSLNSVNTKVRKIIFDVDTSVIRFLDRNVFGKDTSVDTLYFVKVIGANFRSVQIFNENNTYQYDANPAKDSYFFNNRNLRNILEKIGTINSVKFKWPLKVTNWGKQTNPVWGVEQVSVTTVKRSYIFVNDTSINTHRVVSSYMSNSKIGIDVAWYVKPGIAVRNGYTIFEMPSAQEARNLTRLFRTKLFGSIYYLTRTNRTLQTPQLKFLPEMNLAKIWSDEELYAYFNLTQDEIDYIEETIK